MLHVRVSAGVARFSGRGSLLDVRLEDVAAVYSSNGDVHVVLCGRAPRAAQADLRLVGKETAQRDAALAVLEFAEAVGRQASPPDADGDRWVAVPTHVLAVTHSAERDCRLLLCSGLELYVGPIYDPAWASKLEACRSCLSFQF